MSEIRTYEHKQLIVPQLQQIRPGGNFHTIFLNLLRLNTTKKEVDNMFSSSNLF